MSSFVLVRCCKRKKSDNFSNNEYFNSFYRLDSKYHFNLIIIKRWILKQWSIKFIWKCIKYSWNSCRHIARCIFQSRRPSTTKMGFFNFIGVSFFNFTFCRFFTKRSGSTWHSWYEVVSKRIKKDWKKYCKHS